MLSVKTDLLAALAVELEQLSPGAGAKAAFESPRGRPCCSVHGAGAGPIGVAAGAARPHGKGGLSRSKP